MPLYEFVCSSCKTKHELLVSHSAKPPCPACDQPKLERQLSVISIPSTGGSAGPAPAAESCGTPRCCGGG